MSSLPSPVKSPAWTSTQVTLGLHEVHSENENALPVLMPTHHWPDCTTRAAMSVLPSPLKSPVTTSTQVTAVDSEPNMASLNALLPLDMATRSCPLPGSWPRMAGTNAVPLRKNRPVK